MSCELASMLRPPDVSEPRPFCSTGLLLRHPRRREDCPGGSYPPGTLRRSTHSHYYELWANGRGSLSKKTPLPSSSNSKRCWTLGWSAKMSMTRPRPRFWRGCRPAYTKSFYLCNSRYCYAQVSRNWRKNTRR
jgi:hypothetical protein